MSQFIRPVTLSSAPLAPSRGYAHQLNQEFLVEKKGLKAKVFDGKKLADTINNEVAEEIRTMIAQGQRSVHECWISTAGVC